MISNLKRVTMTGKYIRSLYI